PCKGDNIPLDPRTCACGAFLYFFKVNAVAVGNGSVIVDFSRLMWYNQKNKMGGGSIGNTVCQRNR
ncbi:MAG: hypothetical protein K6B38_00500, partial [Ruminococcus sp.]|nr:hypothetical protein [Ruminococcus sp.]